MPVILEPDSYELWLDPGIMDSSTACNMPKPYDARLRRCYSVNTRINHVTNDDEECSAPVELARTQASLSLYRRDWVIGFVRVALQTGSCGRAAAKGTG